METTQVLNKIAELAQDEEQVIVVWLYGSRARDNAHENSDYDLAVAFDRPVADLVENRLRPEILALTWQEKLQIELSIVDINIAPIPLAITIVEDDTVIFGKETARRYIEEQRIMSMWELDYQYGRVFNE